MGATDRFLKRGRIQDFSRSPIAKMLSELRKFGANGHMYIPGVGAISGITAGNYLDSIGTTSASVDGNVGLVLDGVGSLGAELAPALVPVNWNVINTDATHLITWGASSFRYQCDTFSPSLTIQKGLLTTGKTYKVEITVSAYTSGSLKSDTSAGIIVNGLGKFSFVVVAATPSFNLYRNAAVTDLTVSGISIKEVTGIHASQATTGYQPKLRRGIVNLLNWSNDPPQVSWLKSNASFAGYKLVADATSSWHFTYASYTPVNDAKYTVCYLLKKAEHKLARLAEGASGAFYASVDLDTGAVFATGGVDFVSASAEVLTDGSVLLAVVTVGRGVSRAYSVVGYPSAGATLGNYGAQYTGDNASGIYVFSRGLFQGSLTAQQITAAGGIPLTTSTNMTSSSAGAYKWEFDGADDFLSLGAIPFGMADDHFVSVAARVDSFASNAPLFSLGNSGINNARIQLYTYTTTGQITGLWRDDAGTAVAVTAGAPQVGAMFVASLRKIGESKLVRLNSGAGGASSASVGTTTFDKARIGESAGAFAKGQIGGLLAIKGTVTDSQALIFERGLNALSQYAAGRF